MIISRGRSILKLCISTRSLLSKNQINNCIPKKWHGEYKYRKPTELDKIDKRDLKVVEFISAFFWWWVLWHFFSEYEALIGPTVPDPSKWTDEELGVPPL